MATFTLHLFTDASGIRRGRLFREVGCLNASGPGRASGEIGYMVYRGRAKRRA